MIQLVPYPWTDEYRARQYKVHKDDDGFYYFVIEGKKIYFPQKIAVNGLGSELLRSLMIEQDKRSPHLYFSENVSLNNGGVFLDIGAAEGLITLLNIEKIKKAYLFECDQEWVEMLKKTFEPYADKVEIINKYVSEINDETHTTLDAYLDKHYEDSICMKMDIEGMETEVIPKGIGKNMGNKNLKFVCCTYHKKDDAKILENIFKKYGYETEFSDGYLAKSEAPHFRKGIIRAWSLQK
jgi:hypothetical protein